MWRGECESENTRQVRKHAVHCQLVLQQLLPWLSARLALEEAPGPHDFCSLVSSVSSSWGVR